MKKLFTLFTAALMALATQAQEPLYTITTTVAADAEWGEEYASDFAFQGTKVNVEVYADNYIIIKNWAGAEGCDLKVEYDPNIDVDADDCNGNIVALTVLMNGVEQEPLNTYSKEVVSEEDGQTYNYNYIDITTGRTDYPVCSTTLNEDGTFYWSFVEVDKEAKTGYVELSAYFMTEGYDTENLGGSYYYVGWPEAEAPADPVFYGNFMGETGEMFDEDGNVDAAYGVAFLKDLTDITVDVYDQYVLIHDWSKNPASPRDLKLTCSHDDNQYITSLLYINTTTGAETEITNGKYIYTGYKGENYLYQVYAYPLGGYSNADWSEEGGYALIAGYPYYKENDDATAAYGDWGYYYLYWGYDEEDAIAAIKAAQAKNAAYNLAGQKVGADYKGIVVRDGKKILQK